MIERHQDRLQVNVPMVVANATALLGQGRQHMGELPAVTIDLGQVSKADSSSLAVMLGWQRSADMAQKTLEFINIPTSIRALADLYGIEKLLPLA